MTGAAAAVAVLASGGAAAADGGPAPAYRMAADTTQHGTAASRPDTGWAAASLPLSVLQAGPALRKPASPEKQASHRKSASSLRLSFGARLAGAVRGTSSRTSARRPSHQHTAPAHHQRTRPAHRTHARACSDSRLHWWICHVEGVLERHGTPRGRLSTGAAYIVVQHESGGNPHAYNGWDINAAQGHPSEGIAQVIGPTFHAYALRGYGDIWNPVDNMIAAFRYAISRYGSMNNIPGVVAVRQGGSYVGY